MSWIFKKNKTHYKQGYYIPENKEKYVGNAQQIFFRSSWELKLMIFLDRNPLIEKWASEPFPIQYINLGDKTKHKYYIDFWAITGGKKWLLEVKPIAECFPPKQLNALNEKLTTKKIQRYNKECLTYIRNISKWKAAKQFCDSQGWIFYIFSEDDFKKLNIKT